MRWLRWGAGALMLMPGALAGAESVSGPEVVATIPSPAFNENISEDVDGAFYVTGAFERNLWRIRGGAVEKFAHFDQYAAILGVAAVPEGIVVGAFRRDFRTPQGVDFSIVGSEVMLLDKPSGKILATVPGQKGQVFNGMVADGRGKVLITDSLGASVWQFDPRAQSLGLWIKDEALASSSPAALGANGIKVAGEWVYIANREKLSIFRVKIDDLGRAEGPLTLVAKDLPHADDFAVAGDGTIFLPPSDQAKPSAMIRISPSGERNTVTIGRAGASAMVSRDGKWVYWATNNGLAPKTSDPQHLVRVPVTSP